MVSNNLRLYLIAASLASFAAFLPNGMPMPDYDVTVGQDGSRHSGVTRFPENPEARGEDLQSLFDCLVERGDSTAD
jgi:hypothetical protein